MMYEYTRTTCLENWPIFFFRKEKKCRISLPPPPPPLLSNFFMPGVCLFFFLVREVGDVRGYTYPVSGKLTQTFEEGKTCRSPPPPPPHPAQWPFQTWRGIMTWNVKTPPPPWKKSAYATVNSNDMIMKVMLGIVPEFKKGKQKMGLKKSRRVGWSRKSDSLYQCEKSPQSIQLVLSNVSRINVSLI